MIGDPRVRGRWSLLSTHGLVLLAVVRNPRATQREIALLLGLTEKPVNMALRDLEEAGMLRCVRQGRRLRYELCDEAPVLHPPLGRLTVGQLVSALRTAICDSRNAERP